MSLRTSALAGLVCAAIAAPVAAAAAEAAPAEAAAGDREPGLARLLARARAQATSPALGDGWTALATWFADWRGEASAAPWARWAGWRWLDETPAQVGTLGVELQLRARDLTARAHALAASLLPFAPVHDLSPLVASPVPGVESSGFGWRRDPFNRRSKFHKGTDFRADRGTPVYAAGAGVVAFAGRQRGYGNVIYVEHGGGLVTRYAHLARIEVEPGALLVAGHRVGQVGSTGRATGPHLHFEVRLDGRAVDPTVAMHVGALQRTDPVAGQLAALALAPEAQERAVDRHDPARPGSPRAGRRRTAAAGDARPERASAPARERALW